MDIIENITKEFNSRGYQLYEVGGHVRDRILGRFFNDLDLTTDALPDESKKILEKFGKVYDVGIEYGTIGFVSDLFNIKVEVTTFRGEVYPTDSRKPNVVFGKYLYEDLKRRDFTINAIARHPVTGEFIDYHGGLKDIENRIIRCVGSDDRLDEDPLRMLRAVRFACQLGFKLDVAIKHPERLKIISKERIKEELSKIIMSDNPERGIRLLCDTGLMQYVIPEFMNLKSLQGGKNHMKDAYEHTLAVVDRSLSFNFGKDNLIFVLSCLLHDIGKPTTFTFKDGEIHFYDHHMVGGDMTNRILKELRFDSETVERVTNLVRRHMEPIMLTISNELTKRGVARLIRRVSSDSYNDIEMLLALTSCDLSSSANPRHQLIVDLRKLVSEVQAILPKQESPLNGNEIMELLNLKPSKMVGEIKEFLCDKVVDGAVSPNDKEALKALAKEYHNGKQSS